MYLRMLGISKKTPERIMEADRIKVYRANRKIKIRVRAGGEVTCVFSPVIDGKTLMPEDMGDDGLVDGVHPTDLGFWCMANGIMPVLKQALTKCGKI